MTSSILVKCAFGKYFGCHLLKSDVTWLDRYADIQLLGGDHDLFRVASCLGADRPTNWK